MRPIRASEISTFLYCKRAWYYHRKGIEASNIEELAEGSELHHQHGRVVMISSITRLLAYGVMLAALVAFAIYATNLFL